MRNTATRTGEDGIEILPVVVIAQGFPARPSSVPAIRDFVRLHLGRTPLSGEDLSLLGRRVADILLEVAGTGATIEVALRVFPGYAEVDVLQRQPGDLGDLVGSTVPVGGPARPERARAPAAAAPNGNGAAAARAAGAARADGAVHGHPGGGTAGGARDGPEVLRPVAAVARGPAVPFAEWLVDALRREGMTMEAAARRMQVSVKTISRWARGTTEPRLCDLSRMREVFGELPFP